MSGSAGATPEASSRRWALLKSALRVALVIAVVIFGLTLRVVVAGELEIAESSRALVNGDAREAIVHARSAALWFAPGAPHVRVAYARLMALGRAAEDHHDDDAALAAYRSVMQASSSTRWVTTPHAADAELAVAAIARIESTMPRPSASALDPAPAIEKAELEAMTRDIGPRRLWLVVLGASFVTLAGGLIWVILKAFDASGRLDVGRALWPALLALAGVVGWAAALWFA